MLGWSKTRSDKLGRYLPAQLEVKGKEESVKTYKIEGEVLYVPRYLSNYITTNTVTTCPERKTSFKQFKLRPHQVPAVKAIYAYLLKNTGCVLQAHCGSGKTVQALDIARELKTPTIILVHKEFLMNQWVERINQFFPSATVGKIQQKRCDSGKDFDFVIGMIQSISSKDYGEEVYKSFGFMIVDESHHGSATTWIKAIGKFPAKYRLGLTATPKRVDGLHQLFHNHLGPIAYETPRSEQQTCHIHRLDYKKDIPKYRYVAHWDKSKVFSSKLINEVAYDDIRSKHIANSIIRAYIKGRKILVLSDRKKQLNVIEKCLKPQMNHADLGYYIGGMKWSKLQVSSECRVILATYAMAQEALDIDSLDTLFLATPKVNIQQSVGRITRGLDGGNTPIVVDIVDSNEVLQGYWYARRRIYLNELGAVIF